MEEPGESEGAEEQVEDERDEKDENYSQEEVEDEQDVEEGNKENEGNRIRNLGTCSVRIDLEHLGILLMAVLPDDLHFFQTF